MNKAEITYKHKHDTEDVLQVIKGWLLATTYITPTKIKKKQTKPHIGRWYIVRLFFAFCICVFVQSFLSVFLFLSINRIVVPLLQWRRSSVQLFGREQLWLLQDTCIIVILFINRTLYCVAVKLCKLCRIRASSCVLWQCSGLIHTHLTDFLVFCIHVWCIVYGTCTEYILSMLLLWRDKHNNNIINN